MRYVQACYGEKCLIDTETWKFMAQTRESLLSGIDVPFYMWNFDGKPIHKHVIDGKVLGVFNEIWTMPLNGFRVVFKSSGYKAAVLKFDDGSEIGIQCSIMSQSTTYGVQLLGSEFTLEIDRDLKPVLIQFEKPLWMAPNFGRVQGLVSKDISGVDRMSFGVKPNKYFIRYRNRRLIENRCAFLAGPWAVILTDDLKFDSLVLLNGVTTAVLDIASIGYTVNPAVVKAKTLRK